MYLKIAIPRPLDRTFDYEYSIDELGLIQPGDWVVVPFGRSKLVGCVLELSDEKPIMPEGVGLKSVISKINSEFSLPKELIDAPVTRKRSGHQKNKTGTDASQRHRFERRAEVGGRLGR